MWKLNVAHVFFMQEVKFKDAIRYYDPIVKRLQESLVDITAIVLANLCVSYIMTSQVGKCACVCVCVCGYVMDSLSILSLIISTFTYNPLSSSASHAHAHAHAFPAIPLHHITSHLISSYHITSHHILYLLTS